MADMTPEQRTAALRDGARRMGLVDLDLVLLAQDSIPVDVALKELALKYPAAFKAPFDARTAPQAEVDSRIRQMSFDSYRQAATAREPDWQAAGDVRSLSDKEFQAVLEKIGVRR